MIPTNAATGALVTGTGEAWSHPHVDAEANLTDAFCQTTYGASGWTTAGAPSAGPADQAAATKIFAWGYDWTANAADDGIEQAISGLAAGQNYVLRIIAHCTSANNIRVSIDDDTNGGALTNFPDYDFGASTSRTQPGVALVTFELPTIARNGVGADCTAITVRVAGTANAQVVFCHQIELLDNLNNPSLETFQGGNPDIPDGWLNYNLDAGESQPSSAGGGIIHSGSDCIEFAVGASAEGIRQQITAAVGDFITVGIWSYGDGSAGFTIGGLNATQLLVQYSTSVFNIATPHTAVWNYTQAVFRVIAANPSIYVLADAGAAGLRYVDDVVVL